MSLLGRRTTTPAQHVSGSIPLHIDRDRVSRVDYNRGLVILTFER